MKLEDLRDKIDSIDNKMLELLSERMEVVNAVGELKKHEKTPIYRPEREKAIIARLINQNSGLLNKEAIEAIFLEIFAVSRNLELAEKIAYLGPEGTFTHQAAESRFGAMSEYLSMNSISAVFKSVESKRAKYGVVPIENNTDGIVGETLDLLAHSNLKIVSELFLPIHQSFATKCEHLSEIKKIYSKDIVFGQCRNFLNDYNLKDVELIPVDSTAKAAKLAQTEENSAAICSHIAAKLYGVPILFENIEDNHSNKTRFIIISDFKNQISKNDKTSILAKLNNSNKPGSLVNFLSDFNNENINLTKIESRPMREGSFEYWFFIDFEGHFDQEKIKNVFKRHTSEIKWLGSYIKADSN